MKLIKLLSLFAALLLLAGACAAEPDRSTTTVAYASPAGEMDIHRIDVHRRDDGKPKRWAVLIHGGSWASGDKANFDAKAGTLIDWWLDRGFAVAAVNFRLATRPGVSPKVRPVDQAADVAHALAHLQTQSETYGVAPTQMVAFGFSSGAHLVALVGADADLQRQAGLAPDTLAATISFDVHAYDVPLALKLMEGSVVSRNIPMIRHLFGPTEAEQRTGSPSALATKNTPPALLVSAQPSPEEPGSHGYVASKASEAYAARLTELGVRAQATHFDDETHNSLVMDFGTPGDAPTEAVRAFLKL